MSNTVGLALLAGGEGTRLKTPETKILVPLLGKRLIDFSLETLACFREKSRTSGPIGLVVGKWKKQLEEHLSSLNLSHAPFLAFQPQPQGTADALNHYFDQTPEAKETSYTLIMYGDTPLVRATHLERLWQVIQESSVKAVAASFETDEPTGYGRILHDADQEGFCIVEEKEATFQQKQITEVNAGVYLVKTNFILEKLQSVKNKNNSQEFYLTDIFQKSESVLAVKFSEKNTFKGVNNLGQLEEIERLLLQEKREKLREQGVRLINSEQAIIDWDVSIGPGTLISAPCYLLGNTSIGKNCHLGPYAFLKDSKLEDEIELKPYCHFEKAEVRMKSQIGPYARLREGSLIESDCKIGNFVEIKKSKIKTKAKISHLSYIGDAEIGEETNIGCGFITCNYDGSKKHKTIIGKKTFIGSDTQVIAPIKIGDEVFIGSGSTINQDIPSKAFAIARSKQVTKEGMAQRFLKKKEV